MVPQPTCSSCKFFEVKICRRYPPTVITHGTNIGSSEAYPHVAGGDWCGEHQPKPTVQETVSKNPEFKMM